MGQSLIRLIGPDDPVDQRVAVAAAARRDEDVGLAAETLERFGLQRRRQAARQIAGVADLALDALGQRDAGELLFPNA